MVRDICKSKRTIIFVNGDEFLSNNFKHAFQCAYDRMTRRETRHRVIVVATDAVDVKTLCRNEEVDDNLRAFLTVESLLCSANGSGWFWQKLFYFMPRSAVCHNLVAFNQRPSVHLNTFLLYSSKAHDLP
jgi:hypothetical protein